MPTTGSTWDFRGIKDKDGVIVYYMFRVLPFGLATVPFVFTKLLRPLVKRWRSKGLKVVLHVDDGICVGATKQATSQAAKMIRQDLIQAGFERSQTLSLGRGSHGWDC